jgi:anti-sigma factor RsiW
MDKVTCSLLAALVTDYLEDALSVEDREEFEVHMRRCPPCETYLVQFRKTIEVCGHVHLDVIDVQARTALLAAFEDWKAGR